jgi:hypothetical protein
MMKRRTLNPLHPRNMGVRMQAHHVLSGEGVRQSKLGAKLVKWRYDINTEKNLVFIPSTLQGACYLGVQPHRGNHTAKGKVEVEASDDDYDDDGEERDYHRIIAQLIIDESRNFPKTCKKGPKKVNDVTELMDALAQNQMERIQKKPDELPLTSVAAHFKRRSNVGCGGHDSVTTLEANPVHCGVGRNHNKNQKEGQRKEEIHFVSDGKYQLVMGK